MYKKLLLLIITLTVSTLWADALLMPQNEDYPKDFLQKTTTQINVNINGLIAETEVISEFKNESYDSVDAVYSFPLPAKARVTELFYWYNGVKYKAVLEVKEQAVNPGTGSGGIVAEVNKYIGRNGIKIMLKGIAGGKIQRIQLNYISLCQYYQGRVDYSFPLNTADFITYPLQNLTLNINVNSN